MLASHANVCPFHRSGQITQVRVEPELTFHDAAANVVVTARPDLMYTDDGAWVWRETKTRMQPLPAGLDLLREVPQLALAVLLMSANALGGNPDGARIELEWLTPQCGDVVLLDPHYPGLIRAARDVINGLAAPWHADETARARPGQHCARCPVRRWCPDAESPDAERVPDLVRRVAGTPLGEAGYLVDAATCTPTQTCLELARGGGQRATGGDGPVAGGSGSVR
jgi:PD-(D/E)XK nuclease superfamily